MWQVEMVPAIQGTKEFPEATLFKVLLGVITRGKPLTEFRQYVMLATN